MLHEIALEALRYFDRTALEGLQMHSRHLRDLVNRHARTLPLRYIHDVKSVNGGVVSVKLLNDGRDGIRVDSPDEQSLEALFYRLDNAYIRGLMFFNDHRNLALIHYLRKNAGNLHCRIGALCVIDRATREIDYGLFDFLGVHLKPLRLTIMVRSPDHLEDCAMLYTRSALRNIVENLLYHVVNNTPVPDCIIPELFCGSVVKTCRVITKLDPRPWIVKFIQRFESAEYGTYIVRSVSLLHERVLKASPLRHTIDPLGHPRRTDAPAPRVAWINERLERDRIYLESTVAELFVYENAKTSQKLEVYVWMIGQGRDYSNIAFLIKVVDM